MDRNEPNIVFRWVLINKTLVARNNLCGYLSYMTETPLDGYIWRRCNMKFQSNEATVDTKNPIVYAQGNHSIYR